MSVTALTKKERYLLAARGQETDRPPVWIMRQAGRYDPDYLRLRETCSFHDLCTDPDACARASILPLKNLGVDVLIIFNDILIPLQAMGLSVEFPDSGPVIGNPPRVEADLEGFNPAAFDCPPVARNIRRLRELAGPDVPVIGFAGAPFTLASYAAEGRMSRHQHVIKEIMFGRSDFLHELLRRITDTAAAYLIAQIEQGGADGVQIFESQACMLAPDEYGEFAEKYQRELIGRVKAACPDVPVTLYARGSAAIVESMAASGADVISLDWTHGLADARRRAPGVALQGNLDPGALLCEEAVDSAVGRMLEGFDWRRGYIANLGHGITPQASVAAARRLVERVQGLGEGNYEL